LAKEDERVKTILFAAGATLAITGAMAAEPGGNAAHGQSVFVRCAACHTLGSSGGAIGPNLNGVVGRKAGTLPGYRYSAAMKGSGLTWDSATLARFLAAPMQVVPGTKMIFPGLPSAQDQADVVAYLKQYGPDGRKK
jgi:cytochrome c